MMLKSIVVVTLVKYFWYLSNILRFCLIFKGLCVVFWGLCVVCRVFVLSVGSLHIITNMHIEN